MIEIWHLDGGAPLPVRRARLALRLIATTFVALAASMAPILQEALEQPQRGIPLGTYGGVARDVLGG